ncbi:MAG TPA: hypothetical protein VNI79_06120 [Sphingomicrobium sp.]|nr:hypothetical protein [Sphingomicrobium sp.]
MSSTTVNLDAMILRADFASSDQKPAQSAERFEKIALKDFAIAQLRSVRNSCPT